MDSSFACQSGGFPLETLHALTSKFDTAVNGIKVQKGRWKEAILDSFAHHRVLANLIRPLVMRKKMKDADVVQDWNGKVPTRQDFKLDLSQTEVMQNAVTQALVNEITRLNKGNIAKYTKNLEKILLHPSFHQTPLTWKNDSLAKTTFQSFKNQAAITDEFRVWLTQSPLIWGLLQSDKLRSFVQERQSGIIFVDKISFGKFTKLALKRIIPDIEVKFFHGEAKPQKKLERKEWFKTENGKCRLLIISIKSGGVGLNFPKAQFVIDATHEFNPSVTAQAHARILRVNSTGVKQIFMVDFNTFLDRHVDVIQQKKQAMDQFLFDPHLSFKRGFELWCEVLLSKLSHDVLNSTSDLEKWEAEMTKLKAAIIEFTPTEDELRQAVSLVMPQAPAEPGLIQPVLTPQVQVKPIAFVKPSVALALPKTALLTQPALSNTPVTLANVPRETIAKSMFKTIPLRLDKDAYDQALKLGILLAKAMTPLKEIKDIIEVLEVHPELIEFVRNKTLDQVQGKNKAAANKLKGVLFDLMDELRKVNLAQEKPNCSIKIFELEGNNYVVKDQTNPSGANKIELLRTMIKGKPHFEVLTRSV